METCRRHLPEGHRRRAGHPGRDAGPARVRQRGAVAAVCLQAPVGPFPLSARPVWVQQAAAQAGRHHGLAGQDHGHRYEPVGR